ncbi:MAG: hypothetical protein ABIE03_02085 [Patescibacteria group bacterium]|nr:hypothetical protein [Patescibacteria group bacterium]
MKRILLSVVFLLPIFLIFSVGKVDAAPAPWGIAIKEETGECGGYWSGDEFHYYALPSGWEAYYPEYIDGTAIMETPKGDCNFDAGEKACCEELGLSYVAENVAIIEDDPGDDITEDKMGGLYSPILATVIGLACCFVLFAFIAITIFFVVKKKKV